MNLKRISLSHKQAQSFGSNKIELYTHARLTSTLLMKRYMYKKKCVYIDNPGQKQALIKKSNKQNL